MHESIDVTDNADIQGCGNISASGYLEMFIADDARTLVAQEHCAAVDANIAIILFEKS